jgi:hypothetical protein
MNTISQAASLMGKKGAAQRNKNLSPERKKEIARLAGQGNKGKTKNKKCQVPQCPYPHVTSAQKPER